jgi:hypothetical protein
VLILVTGPPGAGKSTVSELLAQEFEPSVLVPGDKFLGFVRRGYRQPWLPEAHAQNEIATHAAAAAAGQYARGGYTVVYDGVLGPWFLDEFVQWTGLEQVQYAVLQPSEEHCIYRVQQRIGHGFSDIPATRNMWHEFAGTGLDPKHRIAVADTDPPAVVAEAVRDAVARQLLTYRPGVVGR